MEETSPLAVVCGVLRQKLAIHASDVVGITITDLLVQDLTLARRVHSSNGWGNAARGSGYGEVAAGQNPDCPIYLEILGEACKYGRLEALQLLYSFKNGQDFQWGRLLSNWAANFGHWDVIHWVYEQYPGLASGCTLAFAVKENDLVEIKWLTARFYVNYIGDTYTLYSEQTWPVRKACIQYFLERARAVQDVVKGALRTAAEAGDLHFVQWLMSHQLSCPQYVYPLVLSSACEHGHVQVVRCLPSRMEELGLPSESAAIMRTAAGSGQLAVVQWIYEHYGRTAPAKLFEVEEGPTAMEAAAKNGHLEVVQFLHRIDAALRTKRKKKTSPVGGPMCTKRALNAAAGAGHLDVVKWLHTNRLEGCTAAAMDRAAVKGHLDVVEWLHSYRSEGCTSAAMNGVAGRVYHERGCRGVLISCCVDKRPESFVEDQITMLEWLKTNRTEGCTSEALDRAAMNGNCIVLQWLRANTTVRPSSLYPMETAACDGRLDVVKWLHATYPECCTDVAMYSAARNGHLEVVKWLSSNLPACSPGKALIAAAGSSHFSPTRRQSRWLGTFSLTVQRSISLPPWEKP